MSAEVLIVGNPVGRQALLQQVRALGYSAEVVLAAATAATLQIAIPRVIVVCLDDVDPPAFMSALRRAQRGAAIPVMLCGGLIDSGFDLADVLDLGADHFLEEPVVADALAAALEALAGPPMPARSPGEPRSSLTGVADDEPRSGTWPTQTEVLDEPEVRPLALRDVGGPMSGQPSGHAAAQSSAQASGALSGQMQRALGILDARRRSPEELDAAVGESADDLDLAQLGLDDVRDAALEQRGSALDSGLDLVLDPGESQDRLEVAALRVVGPVQASSYERSHRASPGHRETTVLLEDSSPILPRVTTGVRFGTPDVVTSEIHEVSAPVVVTGEFSEGPRHRVPLPLDYQGDLATVEVPRLLSRLHRAAFTGRLTLTSGRVDKSVWFAGGAIVFARSTAGHDRLLDGLLRCGMLTRPQYEEGRRLTEAEGRRAGQVLVEAGFLKQSEMLGALQEHLARIVDSTLPWREGSWRLEPDVRCAEPIQLTTPTAVLLVEGIRQRMEPARLLGLVGGPGAHPRLRNAAAEGTAARLDIVAGLQLLPGEEAWLPHLDGRVSLGELLARPGAGEAELLNVVYAMHVLELLELPGEPLPAPRVADDPVAIDRERILDRLTLAREADYFAVLGLPRDATRCDVRVASADLDRTFADARLEPTTRIVLAAELIELRAALAEARDVLLSDLLRNAYLAQLEEF